MLAITLAQKAGVSVYQKNAIYRRYGDHLYQKGDYDTAMQQYLKAIDNTEPSQVIRKVKSHLGLLYVYITDGISSWTLNGYTT